MPDDEDPPVRRFALKPKEITPTETAARPGDGTAISVELIHRQNEIAARRPSLRKGDDHPQSPPGEMGAPGGRAGFGPKEITPTEMAARPGDGTAISVELIHRQNRIAGERLGPEIIALPAKRRSKRTRDFILLVTVAGGLAGALVLQLPRTPGTLVMWLVLVIVAAMLLAWVMFGVMDDY
jgi:hypothetical protein